MYVCKKCECVSVCEWECVCVCVKCVCARRKVSEREGEREKEFFISQKIPLRPDSKSYQKVQTGSPRSILREKGCRSST